MRALRVDYGLQSLPLDIICLCFINYINNDSMTDGKQYLRHTALGKTFLYIPTVIFISISLNSSQFEMYEIIISHYCSQQFTKHNKIMDGFHIHEIYDILFEKRTTFKILRFSSSFHSQSCYEHQLC